MKIYLSAFLAATFRLPAAAAAAAKTNEETADQQQHPLRGGNQHRELGLFAEGNTFGTFTGLPPAIEWTLDAEANAHLNTLGIMMTQYTEPGLLIVAALVSVCNPLLVPVAPGEDKCTFWKQYDGVHKTMEDFFRDWLYYVPIPESANLLDPPDPLNEPDGPGFYIQRWDWLANTLPGRELILENEEFKVWMTEFLNLHGAYLDSPQSFAKYPGKDFGPYALWESYAGTRVHPFDITEFVTDDGFASYGQFFLREPKAGLRPLAAGDANTIVSPCDGGMFYLHHGDENANDNYQYVLPGKNGDTFGLSESIPGFGPAFAGGKIFDLLLWFTDYHHFHAPVTGTLIYKNFIPGTYNYDFGNFNPETPFTMGSDQHSDQVQWYQTIDKHNRVAMIFDTYTDMGLVAMIPVGFWGVGTMEVYPSVGAQVEKGDHIGHFLYGGSSIVLAFQAGLDLSFVHNGLEIQNPQHPRLVKVKEQIGQLVVDVNGLDAPNN